MEKSHIVHRMILTFGLFVILFGHVVSHGFLDWPPQRSSLWRHGFNTPKNYNDNSLYCGGRQGLIKSGGKCGVCGDPYLGRKENEAGGLYAQGVIAETYPAGTEYIPVTVKLTTHHKGFFEFRICPHNRPNVPVTQECLDRNLLHIKEGDEKSGYTRFYPEKHQGIDIYNLHVEIPAGMRCSQCVLNWRYKTGNSWGTDPDGRSCLGCGLQEEFRNCADIRIEGDSSSASREIVLYSDSNSHGSEEVFLYNSLEENRIVASSSGGTSDIIIENSPEIYGSAEPTQFSEEIFIKDHIDNFVKGKKHFINNEIVQTKGVIEEYIPNRPINQERKFRGPIKQNYEPVLIQNVKPSPRIIHHFDQKTSLNKPNNKNFHNMERSPLNTGNVFLPSLKEIAPETKKQSLFNRAIDKSGSLNAPRNIAKQRSVKNTQSSKNPYNISKAKAREIFMRLQTIKNMRAGLVNNDITKQLGVGKQQQSRNGNKHLEAINPINRNMFLFSPRARMAPLTVVSPTERPKMVEAQNIRPREINNRRPANNVLLLTPPSRSRAQPSNLSSQRTLPNSLNRSSRNRGQNEQETRTSLRNRAQQVNSLLRTRDRILRNNRNDDSNGGLSMRTISTSDLQNRGGNSFGGNLQAQANNRNNLLNLRRNRNNFSTSRRQTWLPQSRPVTPVNSQRRVTNFSANRQNVQNGRFQNFNTIQRQPFQRAFQQQRSVNTSPVRRTFVNQRTGARQSLPVSRSRTVSMNSQFRGVQNDANSRLLPRQRGVLNSLRRTAFPQNRNVFFSNRIS